MNSIDRRVAYLGAVGVGNRGDDYLMYAFAQREKPSLLVGFRRPHFDNRTPFQSFSDAAAANPEFDVAIVCGGSFIWSSEQLNLLNTFAQRAKDAGKQVMARCVHVSSETVYQDPGTFLKFSEALDLFTVRDIPSLDLCSDFRIPDVSFERDALAQLVEERYGASPRPPAGRRVKIGFNFHNLGAESLDWYYEFIATINHYLKGECDLKYVLQCRHLAHVPSNEAINAEYLFTRFNGRIQITPVDSTLDELVSHYKSCDIFISNRTHGLFIAHALGLKVMAAGTIDGNYALAREIKVPLFPIKESPHSAGARAASFIAGA